MRARGCRSRLCLLRNDENMRHCETNVSESWHSLGPKCFNNRRFVTSLRYFVLTGPSSSLNPLSAPQQNISTRKLRTMRYLVQKQKLDTVQNLIYYKRMTDSTQLLRQNGLQVTAQRMAVLRAVSEYPHSTADTIAEGVRKEIGTISRQAVYDALSTLADKGIIRRIQPAGSPALYEDRVDDNHHHVICRTCGKTTDVDCAVGERPCLNAADDSGYAIDEAEVIFWGTCPACQENQTD